MSASQSSAAQKPAAGNLEPFWMPFSANRNFKKNPRLFVAAEGMHYITDDGRKVLDGTAGLWCSNIGHCHPNVVAAVQKQIATLDYASAFQMGHPKAFELAGRVADLMPGTLDHVFFTNSGSEAVDTALKIALAYHAHKGQGSRTRFIGRERAYHGVGFGGISVCGLVNNRKLFGPLLPGVDHLPHTHGLKENLFSRGLPKHGAHLADELERLVGLHGAETIAAVIVEPVAGATGVLLPPESYLKRLREICTKHGILMIMDEVVTAFGRLGNAATASELFGIQPDIVTIAKGLTSGTIPMGGVVVDKKIYDAFMQGPESAIEFFHGYTYSGHPVAAAAGLATLDVYRDEKLFARTAELAPHWENAMHALKGLPHVADIRNFGLIGAVELEPVAGKPGARGFDTFLHCFEKNVLIRAAGDIMVLSPPLIISKEQIDEIFGTLADALKKLA